MAKKLIARCTWVSASLVSCICCAETAVELCCTETAAELEIGVAWKAVELAPAVEDEDCSPAVEDGAIAVNDALVTAAQKGEAVPLGQTHEPV
jgi:hypothetical protein